MLIIDNAQLETFDLPGIKHQTVGGHKQGVRSMEVWVQTIAPGASTPIHCHACEEVVVILSGSGECTIAGKITTFGPDSTLIIEPDIVHQIVNSSTEELKLAASLGMAPVRVKTGKGEPLTIPWDGPLKRRLVITTSENKSGYY
jgi:mannose-6-phosphate isomerase-like protein (cupin superfamily)